MARIATSLLILMLTLPLVAQPIAWNGWIYAGTEDGRLIAINTKDANVTGWPTWGGDAGRTSVRL